jgi:Uma2 family endonuclease
MITVTHEGNQVSIPEWVVDLESFRRWADADDFPQIGRLWYLKGEVWVDLSNEQVFSHVLVKNEITAVLRVLVKAHPMGLFLGDGVLLTNIPADISGNPDATFVSHESLRSNRVRLIQGKEEGYVELEGTPDMVLEVISRSSVRKDNVELRQAYWEAGIREYWLVDARKEPLLFTILRHTAKGYSAVRKQDGWLKSAMFGKSFRLTSQPDFQGNPDYTLEVR